MSTDVPRRNLESLKKEAKRWHDALRAQDSAARERLERALDDVPDTPSLRDVQHAMAREHGFASWAQLKRAIEQARTADRGVPANVRAQYDEMARALLEAYRTGNPEAMERHYRYTWHRRAWHAMRTYVQLDLGKRPIDPGADAEITLDDARQLVAVEYGFSNWTELEAFTESGAVRPRVALKPLRIVRVTTADSWDTIATAREWDQLLDLLRQQGPVGLSAEGQMTDALLAELSRIETITALGLSGCKAVTDEGVRHLAQMQGLRDLDLSGTGVTDAGLQALRSLRQLRTLSLAWTRVSDAGVANLSLCDELERVNLSATHAGVGALHALAGKRKLHHLDVALSDTGLALLRELPQFKSWQGGEARLTLVGPKSFPNHLSLSGSFTNDGLQHLRALEGLFSLSINSSTVTSAGLEPLVSLPRLGAISVDATDDWMPYLAAMPRLRFLSAQDTVAGDEGFEALSKSQSLEYIWGRRCHNLQRRGFVALARLPALRGLSVSCLNVDDAGVSALPAFPALIELMPMDVPDAGYRHVGRCAQLESLVLMYCRETTDAATEQITGLRNLQHYFNSYTTITDRTPELLATMDSLERVTFDTCHGLTNRGVARLARLPRLRELRVSGKGISAEIRPAFPKTVTVFFDS